LRKQNDQHKQVDFLLVIDNFPNLYSAAGNSAIDTTGVLTCGINGVNCSLILLVSPPEKPQNSIDLHQIQLGPVLQRLR